MMIETIGLVVAGFALLFGLWNTTKSIETLTKWNTEISNRLLELEVLELKRQAQANGSV